MRYFKSFWSFIYDVRGVYMLLDLKKVFLDEKESVNVNYNLDLHDFDFNGIQPFETPVEVTARVENKSGVVCIAINAEFDYTAPCDRCGEETIAKFGYSFEHTLVQSLSGENDGDYIEIPDLQLDLDELITSDIVLSLPSKYLCSEECKGLCPKCGQNLNKDVCKCDLRQVDPRLEALKDLL